MIYGDSGSVMLRQCCRSQRSERSWLTEPWLGNVIQPASNWWFGGLVVFRASLLSLDKGFNQILIPELVVGIGVWDLSRCSCGADGKPPPNTGRAAPFVSSCMATFSATEPRNAGRGDGPDGLEQEGRGWEPSTRRVRRLWQNFETKLGGPV